MSDRMETLRAGTPDYQTILRGMRRRRKRLMVGVFLCLAIPSLVGIFSLSRPLYQSTAILLLQPIPVMNLPNLELNPDNIVSALTLLKSRSVAEDVVEALPQESLEELLAPPQYVEYVNALNNRIKGWMGKPITIFSSKQQAVGELIDARMNFREDMRADSRSQSVIVTIKAGASRPRAAKDLVNTYLQVLLNRTRGVDQEETRKTRGFLENQVQQVKGNLTEAEQSLKRFEAQRGPMSPGRQTELDVTRLSQAESALSEVQASRAALTVRIRGLQEALNQSRLREANSAGGNGKDKAGESGQGADAMAKLNRFKVAQDRLAKREEKLAGLRERYTESHPLVRVGQEDVSAAQAQVAQLARELPGTLSTETVGVLTVPEGQTDRVESVRNLAALQVEEGALQSKARTLEVQVERLRKSLRSLSQDELGYSNLRRTVEAQRELLTVLSDKLMGTKIREQRESSTLRIIDAASLPLAPTRSKDVRYALGALLLSGALAVGLGFGVETWRQPVETEADIRKATRFDVLGSVGIIKREGKAEGPLYLPSAASHHLELYRAILASIETERLRSDFRSILVTSPGPSVGKSTTVLNLAQVLQEYGRRVLIVEADLRRPSLYSALAVGVRNTPGLPDFLRGTATFEQVCRVLPRGVTLIPGVPTRDNAGSLLQLTQIEKLLALARAQFDVVLVDSAPLLVVSDTRLLLPPVDRVVLVVKAGQTTIRELRHARALLKRADARVLGVVLNQAHRREMYYYTRQYAKYYKLPDREAAAKPAVSSLREKHR